MRRLLSSRPVQLFAAMLLIILSPIVGLIPGPGGVFVFAAGLVLLLRNSRWARRQFARGKRRWPRVGAMLDRGLRRGSAQRRRAIKVERSR
jgi:predicted membrane metal-binding protein